MNDAPFFSDDDPNWIPSARTERGRTSPRGERLRAGDVLLGRYTVLEELGKGGMGVVYKCFDRVGGIEVALKCLPPELSRDEAEMEGIRENYAIVAKLHHSAISGLRNLERDPDGGDYYVVMDLAEGDDLLRVLRRRRGAPMPPAEALDILRPLAAALDYAHAEGVLHRDVKPANVKVRPSAAPGEPPRVQLLDFGLAAQVRSSLSRVSSRGHLGSSGTPTYMAPEQWEARRQTPATDQYALAVMAYEMLAGEPPFAADDNDILRQAVLGRDPDPVDGIAAAVNAALLRALAKDPKDRFSSCAAFVAALAGETDGRDGSPSRPPAGRAAGASLPVSTGAPGGASPPGEPPRLGGDASPRPETAPPSQTALEADVLLRKVDLSRALASLSAADRDDPQLAPLAAETDKQLTAAEEGCRYGRFETAAQCLDRAQDSLDAVLREIKRRCAEEERRTRKEAELRARVEADRRAREERARKEAAEAWARLKAAKAARAARERRLLCIALLVVAIPGILAFAGYSFVDWIRTTKVPTGARRDAVIRSLIDNMVPCPDVAPGFLIGKYEVTQEEWAAVTGTVPSHFKGRRRPVESVSLYDCHAFLKKLNGFSSVQALGLTFRLPTEKEWERACQAGAPPAADYCKASDGGQITAETLSSVAVFGGSWNDGPADVGSKDPNAWGLHDVHGNVREWTDAVADNEIRACRGGSFLDSARDCSALSRDRNNTWNRFRHIGLRLAATQKDVEMAQAGSKETKPGRKPVETDPRKAISALEKAEDAGPNEKNGKKPDATESPAPAPVSLAVISRYAGRPSAGLVEKSSGRSYYLSVGEVSGPYRLVDVSPDDGTAVVAQGTNQWSVSLEKKQAADPASVE